jgi:predicted metal-dependent peptidase
MALSETLKRIQRARTTMLIDMPFFGVLALQLQVIESDLNETAWTNGQQMGFNPKFVSTLTNDQLIAVIAHEVMHCACGHPWRESGREHIKWNMACDYAINPILTDSGLTLPDGCLNDSQYAGKSAEWIFDRLPDQPKNGGGCGTGEVLSSPQGADGDQPGQATESDWQQYTKQAIQAAKQQGKLPGKMLRNLEQATAAKVDWRSLLRRYMQDLTTADYSWQRPNKRHLAGGLYLPTLRSHACGKIAIAVDTSGSIDEVTLSQFCGEMQSIISEMQPSSTEVLYCDAAVNHIDVFERHDPLTMKAVGGGGTSFSPVFEHFETSDSDQPIVLVYFTDMYGSFPDTAPEYPVIWASTSEVDKAPFGDVVPINQ